MYKDILDNSSDVAQYLKLFAHEGRLTLICLLVDGKKSVSELQELSNISQSQISQFLKIFELSDIVSSNKEGKWTYYEIKSKETVKLLKTLKTIFC